MSLKFTVGYLFAADSYGNSILHSNLRKEAIGLLGVSRSFTVNQSHRSWYQPKASMRFYINLSL